MSTVGVNEKVIKKYIEMQGQEDSGQAQLELKRSHGRKPVEIHIIQFSNTKSIVF